MESESWLANWHVGVNLVLRTVRLCWNVEDECIASHALGADVQVGLANGKDDAELVIGDGRKL